jgi:15-cis-phytoene synthase
VKTEDAPLPPPMVLAIAYAHVPVRARLAWLLALDRRLADVLTRASEPMIAQLRLSWWRDALNCLPDKRPKGEPLLSALNDLGSDDVAILAGMRLVDAYEVLATSSDSQEEHAARKQRISALCGAFASWVGGAESESIQIDEIANWWSDPILPLPKSLPRILRPLSVLALAEQLELSQNRVSPLRLNWHALTGR